MRFSEFVEAQDLNDLEYIVGYKDDVNIKILSSVFFTQIILGFGTEGFIPKFTGTNSLDDSIMFQDGASVVFNGTISRGFYIDVYADALGGIKASAEAGIKAISIDGEEGEVFYILGDADEPVRFNRPISAPYVIYDGGTSSDFVKGDGSLDSTQYQDVQEKGQPDGYASLDEDGLVPVSQLPTDAFGFNTVANADDQDQFNSESDKKIRFEGTGAASVSFDQLGNKVIINSEPAVGNSYLTEIDMILDQSNQTTNNIYYAGDTYYQYLGTTNGNITDYREIMSGMKWLTVDQDVVSDPNVGYITNKTSSRLVVTLPSTGIEYSIRVAGRSSSGWRILAPVGGKISWIDEDLITTLDSISQWDAIELVAVTPGNYVVISSIGNIQFTK